MYIKRGDTLFLGAKRNSCGINSDIFRMEHSNGRQNACRDWREYSDGRQNVCHDWREHSVGRQNTFSKTSITFPGKD